ncbi:MAG: bifunctional phosphoribosyl-AMP cyclohydrolase/phosphoribosyl-ATP diphosphatase HisIE [Acholeplasmataceae bacterium]|jgi:phosphoribosyl-ATP pyrophosphohydrolase/phosphoribosyl-AMP cyclohydrolase|nr:bifunctional phosphoribosyl-AMP cyclohydrolase/phosphoribosyl-ATP diphosphatase HisIE [Acholeplasmataceae bacterium]
MKNESFNISEIKYNNDGLVPVVVQDVITQDVLMLAYMNEEALKQTIETKKGTYYSRSRKSIWVKGESSGNTQEVKGLFYDCDEDSLLLKVLQTGVACHTGNKSCFYREIFNESINDQSKDIITELYEIISERKLNPVEGSYTTYLFTKGIDKILKKVGEETSEIIIGAKNNSKTETVYEISDLVYHILVLMVNQGINPIDIVEELKTRRK